MLSSRRGAPALASPNSSATRGREIPGGEPAPQRLQLQYQYPSVHGTLLYTPRRPSDAERRSRTAPAFPTPHIRPRSRRRHTIHIVAYPPGYIPPELRSLFAPPRADKRRHGWPSLRLRRKPPAGPKPENADTTDSASASSASSASTSSTGSTGSTGHADRRPRRSSSSHGSHTSSRPGARLVLDKFLSAFVSKPAPPTTASAAPPPPPLATSVPTDPPPPPPSSPASAPLQDAPPSRRSSFLRLGRRQSLTPTARSRDSATEPSGPSGPSGPSRPSGPSEALPSSSPPLPATATATTTHAAAMPRAAAASAEEALSRPTATLADQHSSHRDSLMSVRSSSVKNIMTSSLSEVVDPPLASGGGLACAILLAEPHVFLTGFDHDGRTHRSSAAHSNGSALLRGKLQVSVTKSVKIRAITLKLRGKARTEWPEGIPPLKLDLFEEESLRTQGLTFFHAMHDAWETPYGNQCTYSVKKTAPAPDSPLTAALSKFSPASAAAAHSDTNSLSSGMSARDIKRLSLQQVKTRSFGKGDSVVTPHAPTKGYKVFHPGVYEYTFEMPIDHHQLETIRLPYAMVKWELETTIERSGAFKPNLHGTKEVSIVRVPDQLSLETVEPISIRRRWEDQLFYDIIISGKSFPIGGKIPIAFKLMPLAKVQLHKLKVYVTETVEYFTSSHRITRRETGRKLLLFEKTAGKPIDERFRTSDLTFLSGGELSPEERSEARATALRRRDMEARRSHNAVEPLPAPSENLLGDLDLGLETYWGATELEMNVQIPTCKQMAQDPNLRLHPDCSWKNASVHHWIKVVMRLSRTDPEAEATSEHPRRHFEVSIDSPFHILNCLATQANTALPQYTGRDLFLADGHATASCGCPDADTGTLSPAATGSSSSVDNPGTVRRVVDVFNVSTPHLPTMPQAAHLQAPSPASSAAEGGSGGGGEGGEGGGAAAAPTSNHEIHQHCARTDQEAYVQPRPIHLLRVPSFAPPAFDADESPPVPADVMTPPPNYDAIIGTPSVDGLADYFSRLARYDDAHPCRGAGAHGRGGAGGNSSGGAHIALDDETDSEGELDLVPSRITSRGGRVNVANPRTPGGRPGPSRSMDIQRPVLPFHLHLTGATLRRGAA